MRSLVQYLAYILVYGATWLLAMLPRPLFYALADLNAFLLCYVVRYRRRTVLQNLRNSFPQKPEPELRRIAWAFYRHLADLFLEEAFLMHASTARIMKRCQIEEIPNSEQYYQQGRSIVVACAHYGNWEFLGLGGLVMKHRVLSVYKAIQNKRLERLAKQSRERFGNITVEMRQTLRAVAKFNQEGTPVIVGLISDQIPISLKQYWGTFLNQETLVFRGVEDLAKRYNMPVFFCKLSKSKRGYYRVEFEFITDQPNATPRDWITEQHLRALERCIVEKPEYWLWSHRRWKRKRPKGE